MLNKVSLRPHKVKLHLRSPPSSELVFGGRVLYMATLGGQDLGHNRLFPRFPRELWMCKTLELSPFPLKDADTSLLATLPTNCIFRVNTYMNLNRSFFLWKNSL